jgi:hypothetical protein
MKKANDKQNSIDFSAFSDEKYDVLEAGISSTKLSQVFSKRS